METDCPTCDAYFERREPVLTEAIAHQVERTHEAAETIFARFVRGVHQRHLAGLSLATDES